MKRSITLFTLLLVILSFIACGGGSGSSTSGTFEKMPSGMETFAYISPKNIKTVEWASKMYDSHKDVIEEEYAELIDYIDEAYIGVEKIGMNEMDPDVVKTKKIVAILKGNFDKEKIKKAVNSKYGDKVKEEKIEKIDALTSPQMSVLFVDKSTVLVSSHGFEKIIIDAYVNGKGTVDKNSATYKKAMQMKPNLAWFVSDFSIAGEMDLAAQSMGMLKGKSTFGVTGMGLTGADKSVTVCASSVTDSPEVSKEISESINGVIQMFKGMIVGQLEASGVTGQAKQDIEKIVNDFKVTADGNVLETKINIKESTLKELEPLMEQMHGF